MTAPAGGHERVYRGLLRFYPADYRRRFGDQMVQLFGDQLRDAGPTQTWLRAAADLPTSAASEHLRRNRTMAHSMTLAPTPASRILGLLGILGGAVFLVAFVLDIGADLNMLRLFIFLIGSMAVMVAVHQAHARVAPHLALAGLVPALFGFGWLLVMELLLIGRQPPVFGGTFGWVFFWASLSAWAGAVWFGAVAFKLGVVTRVGSLAVAVGFAMGITGIDRLGLVSTTNATIFNTISLIGLALGGVGLILLGLDVALRRRPATAQKA